MHLLVGGVLLLVISNGLGQGRNGLGNGNGNGMGNGVGNGIGNGKGNGNGNGKGTGIGNGMGNGIGNGKGNGIEKNGGVNRGEKNQNPTIKTNDLILSSGFKDVFKPGMNRRPTLGTTTSTCWARGGICINIRQCPSLNMDIGVAGCSWGYKVCCKIHAITSPTVGRRVAVPILNNLDELGAPLQIIALRNSMLLTSWQEENPDHGDIKLDDII